MKNLVFVILVLVLIAGAAFVGIKLYKRQKLASLYQNQGSTSTTNNTNSTTNSPTSNETESSGNITLNIDNPADNSSVTTPALTVSGTTTPNAEVSVNEVDTNADSNGKFSATVNLDEGDNTISIVSNDANGNFIEKDINVTYNVAQ